mgnify:CR=1 FL=1
MEELLQVKDLSISFHTYNGEVQAVRNASFDLHRKEVLAIVGESGSGKSVTMQTVLKLTPCELKSGQIIFDGKDITHYTDKQMQEIRGSQIGIIFQDAMTSLNPTMKIGRQITESILRHQKVNKAEAKEKALELLVQVGINNPEKRYHQYIHNLSGGMRQRVMIAIALACKPKLLIADEPTTALDVTIQAQILDLLRNLKDRINSSIMFITHDLGVIAEMADYVVVMYAGRIVEQGTAEEIFAHPAHPYTIGLMASKPVVGKQVDKLYSIPGKVPNPINMPNYCYFKDRCEMCVNGCEGAYPHEISLSPTHKVSCYRYYPENMKKEGE